MTERERTHALLLCSAMLETIRKIEDDLYAARCSIEEFARHASLPANDDQQRGRVS